MSIYSIIFSPTGGTRRCAEVILKELGESSQEINLMDRNEDFSRFSLGEGDVAVISAPSYGGRVPGIEMERLSMIRGGGARAVLLCVYGNRAYEDTLAELEDGAVSAGFVPVAAVAAIAEHSIARLVAKGRPDEDDVSELSRFGKKIREKQVWSIILRSISKRNRKTGGPCQMAAGILCSREYFTGLPLAF